MAARPRATEARQKFVFTDETFGVEILEKGYPFIHARTPIRFEVLPHRLESGFDRAVGVARGTGDHSAVEHG